MVNDNEFFAALSDVINDNPAEIDYDDLDEKLSKLEVMFNVRGSAKPTPEQYERELHEALTKACATIADKYGLPAATVGFETANDRRYSRVEIMKALSKHGIVSEANAGLTVSKMFAD